MTNNHNKIINAAARAALKPEGAIRKGQSRLWMDDHGWAITIIEFQPASNAGSYLNIGVHFFWYPEQHFTFHAGYRQQDIGFIQYRNDEQFTPKAQAMAEEARHRMLAIRQQMTNLTAASQYAIPYLQQEPVTLWSYLHQGMFSLLQGNKQQAMALFQQVIDSSEPWDWALAAKAHTQQLMTQIADGQDYIALLNDIVKHNRQVKKLPERTVDLAVINQYT